LNHAQDNALTDQRSASSSDNCITVVASPGAVRWLLSGITAGLLIAHTVTQVGIYGFGADKHWLDPLNMDRELNVPTLFSSALLLLIALLLKRLKSSDGHESPADWQLLSRIFFFLALDEALQIHEVLIIPDLRHHVHPALASTWVIPYGAFVAVVLWRFRGFLQALPADFSARALRAGAVYVGGTIGVEMLGSFAVRSDLIRLHSFWYGGITGLEESMELCGLILFIHALMQELMRRHEHGLLQINLQRDAVPH